MFRTGDDAPVSLADALADVTTYHRRLHESAAKVLSPAQLKVFDELQADELNAYRGAQDAEVVWSGMVTLPARYVARSLAIDMKTVCAAPA